MHTLTETDRQAVAHAVTRAEGDTSGEILTVIAERSDGYTDVALVWAVAAAFTAIFALWFFPAFYLGLADRLLGQWNGEWTPRGIFGLALVVGILKFTGTWLVQLWPPLKYFLIPGPIKSRRAYGRAVQIFRVGAERRTTGRTGILIYLSLREHRAEIVADEAITSRVDSEVWGDAMAAMLAELKHGRIAEGMIAAVERVGVVLAAHLPRQLDDVNELPDRLIEL